MVSDEEFVKAVADAINQFDSAGKQLSKSLTLVETAGGVNSPGISGEQQIFLGLAASIPLILQEVRFVLLHIPSSSSCQTTLGLAASNQTYSSCLLVFFCLCFFRSSPSFLSQSLPHVWQAR